MEANARLRRAGGTIYAQGTALAILQAADILPGRPVDMGQTIQEHLLPEDAFAKPWRDALPDARRSDDLRPADHDAYVLDDPFIYPDETMESSPTSPTWTTAGAGFRPSSATPTGRGCHRDES